MDSKKIIGIIILIVLLVAIPLTIYLSRQKQIFQPRAGNVNQSRVDVYQGSSELLPNGNTPPTVTDPNVQLKIYYVPSPAP